MSKCCKKQKEIKMEFFELKTAEDIFKKAKADFEELKKSPTDSYKAFNFFVTIHHLPEWFDDSIKENATGEREESPILRTVSHLANGAKHFALDENRHKSVKKTEREAVYEEGVYEDGVFEDRLMVSLTLKEQKKFGAEKIDVLELGEKALNHWSKYFE